MEIITAEEFALVCSEILESPVPRFDALARVSYRVLGKYIENLCKNDVYLGRDGKHADDIMSEIQIRLIKKSVSGFFMRDGIPNYSCEEFVKWLFTVAKNVKRDYAERIRREEFRKNKLLQNEIENKITVSSSAYDRLRSAFETVMTSDSKVYKVLTWLTVMIIINRSNVTKIEATHRLVEMCGGMTLDEMYGLVARQSEHIGWMKLSAEAEAEMERRLNAIHKSGKRMGDMVYSDFYMKKGPKATVSDWINRMNGYIEREGDGLKNDGGYVEKASDNRGNN